MAQDEDERAPSADPQSEPVEPPRSGLSRRGFLQGASAGAAAVSLLRAGTDALAATGGGKVVGPGAVPITLDLNGTATRVAVEPRTTLAEALRAQLGLTGTKVGCDRGACSACTVHLDGMPVCSCLTLAIEVGGRKITTIEGLAKGEQLHPVQAAFIAQDAMQCGFCTPGMVMSCAALLARNPSPTRADVQTATSGNLCRCGTYPKVFAATLEAAGQAQANPLSAWGRDRKSDPAAFGLDGKKAPPPQRGGPPGAPKGPPPLADPPRKVAVGILGANLHEEERPVPADEPPAWPSNAELKVVGKPTPRLDGRLKVTGSARYTADVRLPGMLWARRVVSPHPHAKVIAVDDSAAAKLPGVKAVHVVERLTEGAALRDPSVVPADKYPRVRYAGQCVAAVAATSQAIADQAAKLVKVTYEPLPFTVDLDEAQKPDAPTVFPGPTDMPPSAGGAFAIPGLPQTGNVRGPFVRDRGDVKKAFAEAAAVVEGEFRTQVQTHAPMETHGVVADWKRDGLTVYASTQGTATVRDELAEVFKLPKTQIRIICEFMGGGFGAKFGAGSFGVIATHLSKKAGAPVRLMLDRKEEHVSVGNRPSTTQKLRLAARKDGSLAGLELICHGTAGISAGAGVGPWTEFLYPTENLHIEQSDVFTHAGAAAAFRAPGAPQAVFALEQLVDALAEKLQLDPIALRDVLDATPWAETVRDVRKVERRVGAEKAGWAKRHAPGADKGPLKRGLGMAQSIWGRFVDMDSSCDLRLNRDGSVELLSSVMDIGTGTRTALAQVVAEELGLQPTDVTIRIGDTQYPIGPSSGGSKTLVGIAPAVRSAAFQLKQQLLKLVAPTLGVAVDALELSGGKVVVKADPAKSVTWARAAKALPREQLTVHGTRPADYGGDPRAGYGGVQFAQVAVDVETGVITVEKVVAVHDCGRPINPLAVQSQVNGGVLQGISYALYEERRMDRKGGRMLNPNLDQYKILGARETPEIEVVLLEEYLGRTNTEASGIGEPANVATAAAVANAVYNAIGVRVRQLPMTPAAVLAALAQGKGGRG